MLKWWNSGVVELRGGPRSLIPPAARGSRRDGRGRRIHNGLALALPPRHGGINDLDRRVHVAVGRQELRLGGQVSRRMGGRVVGGCGELLVYFLGW